MVWVATGAVEVVVVVVLEVDDEELVEDVVEVVEVEVEVVEVEVEVVEVEVVVDVKPVVVGREPWQVPLGEGGTYPEGGSTSARVWRVPL